MTQKRGRPSVADRYGSDETVTVKITLTEEQLDWLLHNYPDGAGAFVRSIVDLVMKIEAGEMPDDYDPQLWKQLDGMVAYAMAQLEERRGGR
jgi:hypothetical protein